MITFPTPNDGNQIHDIAAHISIFSPEEVQCVDELWQEYQTYGPERSGYY